jgi:hypothetical protein
MGNPANVLNKPLLDYRETSRAVDDPEAEAERVQTNVQAVEEMRRTHAAP